MSPWTIVGWLLVLVLGLPIAALVLIMLLGLVVAVGMGRNKPIKPVKSYDRW